MENTIVVEVSMFNGDDRDKVIRTYLAVSTIEGGVPCEYLTALQAVRDLNSEEHLHLSERQVENYAAILEYRGILHIQQGGYVLSIRHPKV